MPADALALATLLVRGAAVLGAALLVDRLLLRRASAATRYLAWIGAFAALAAAPLVGPLVPRVDVALRIAASPPALAPAAAAPATASGSVAAIPSGSGETRGGFAFPVAEAALALWLAGAALLALSFAARLFSLARIARRGEWLDSPEWRAALDGAAREAGLARRVRLVATNEVPVPLAFGVFRPTIVLPAAAAREWSATRRHAILLHELVHVRRHDAAILAAATILRAIHWPNPLASLSLSRLARERELSCDDAVLGAGEKASDYARHLLAVASAAVSGRALRRAVPAMARTTEVAARVRALLDPAVPRREPGVRGALGAAAAALLLAAPVGALRATPLFTEAPDLAPLLAALGDETVVSPRTRGGPRYGDLPESTVGKEAARALVVRGRAAVEPLLAALRGESPEAAREKAAWALGRIGDRRAAPALEGLATGDESARVRRIAAWALGEMGARDASEALESALEDPEASVRAQAAHALGDLRSKRSIGALVAALADSDAGVRERAAHALGDVAHADAAPALADASRSDPDPDVRAMALWALREVSR